MKRFIITLAIIYISLSVIFSMTISMTGNYDVARHHAPLILVEVVSSTVDMVDESGHGDATDTNGNYIGYSAGQAVQPGDSFLNVFIYNPFSNACDDILARFDFRK